MILPFMPWIWQQLRLEECTPQLWNLCVLQSVSLQLVLYLSGPFGLVELSLCWSARALLFIVALVQLASEHLLWGLRIVWHVSNQDQLSWTHVAGKCNAFEEVRIRIVQIRQMILVAMHWKSKNQHYCVKKRLKFFQCVLLYAQTELFCAHLWVFNCYEGLVQKCLKAG